MTSYSGLSHRHVNAYHHRNSLIFQFILTEFIESFEEIQQLERLCSRKVDVHTKNKEETQKQIESAITKLVGSTRDYMRIFSWNFGDGLLEKLKTYCALLLRNAANDEKEIIALLHYAEKTWQAVMQAKDHLHEDNHRKILLHYFEKANTSLQRFSKVIVRIVPQFRDDENVVFCILRNKEKLDRLHGPRFVAKMLGRMYSKGLKEAHHFLSRKYAERGFDHLLPVITKKISEVEAVAQ